MLVRKTYNYNQITLEYNIEYGSDCKGMIAVKNDYEKQIVNRCENNTMHIGIIGKLSKNIPNDKRIKSQLTRIGDIPVNKLLTKETINY